MIFQDRLGTNLRESELERPFTHPGAFTRARLRASISRSVCGVQLPPKTQSSLIRSEIGTTAKQTLVVGNACLQR
jgi:hypothetical protein